MNIQPWLCGTCGKEVEKHTLADKDCVVIKMLKEVWQNQMAEDLK